MKIIHRILGFFHRVSLFHKATCFNASLPLIHVQADIFCCPRYLATPRPALFHPNLGVTPQNNCDFFPRPGPTSSSSTPGPTFPLALRLRRRGLLSLGPTVCHNPAKRAPQQFGVALSRRFLAHRTSIWFDCFYVFFVVEHKKCSHQKVLFCLIHYLFACSPRSSPLHIT